MCLPFFLGLFPAKSWPIICCALRVLFFHSCITYTTWRQHLRFGFINFQRDFANKIQLSSSSCLLDSSSSSSSSSPSDELVQIDCTMFLKIHAQTHIHSACMYAVCNSITILMNCIAKGGKGATGKQTQCTMTASAWAMHALHE